MEYLPLLAVAIGIVAIVGLILRGMVLWYWRIDDIVNNLKYILAELKTLNEVHKPTSGNRDLVVDLVNEIKDK